jgi:hypothetical protein
MKMMLADAIIRTHGDGGTLSVDWFIRTFFFVLIIGGICWLLWWLIGFLGVPEPFAKILRGIVAVFAVLVLINILLSLIGHPIFTY